MKSLINDQRFFSEVLPHIGNKNKIIEELVENAVRAKASKVEITLKGDKITCVNDGRVLDDFTSLLTVASTDYDADVVKSQKPAGLGIMMMLAASNTAKFFSGSKTLTIDCKKFFANNDYRDEISSLLMNQSQLVVKGGNVDGFKSVFTCNSNFLQSLEMDLFSHKKDSISDCFERRYQYYNINITINGLVVERCKHNWLVQKQGVGVFKGCVVGIQGGLYENRGYHANCVGEVYWFGKRISCPQIAPFTIVVDDNTDCIMPSLPDRGSISTVNSELAKLKEYLEDLVFDDVNEILSMCLGKNTSIFYNQSFRLLSKLDRSYNVENFKFWDDVEISDVALCYDGSKSSFIINDDTGASGSIFNQYYVQEGIYEIRLFHGGTKAPKSLLNKYTDKLNISCSERVEHEGYVGNQMVLSVKVLSVNGINIQWLESYDSGDVYITHDVDRGEFTSLLVDININNDYQCGEYEYEEDLTSFFNFYNKVVDVNKIKFTLMQFIPDCELGDMDEMTVEFKGKDVVVKLENGSVHKLKAA